MAEWQIGHRKSSLVLSAPFPVVKWRSRSVAKSTYFKADVSKTPTRGRDRSWSLLYFRFIFFCFLQTKTWSRRTKHNTNGPRPNPCPHPFPSPPKKCKFGVMTLSEGRDRYAVSPESYPSRVLSYPSLRTEWEGRNNPCRVDPSLFCARNKFIAWRLEFPCSLKKT